MPVLFLCGFTPAASLPGIQIPNRERPLDGEGTNLLSWGEARGWPRGREALASWPAGREGMRGGREGALWTARKDACQPEVAAAKEALEKGGSRGGHDGTLLSRGWG